MAALGFHISSFGLSAIKASRIFGRRRLRRTTYFVGEFAALNSSDAPFIICVQSAKSWNNWFNFGPSRGTRVQAPWTRHRDRVCDHRRWSRNGKSFRSLFMTTVSSYDAALDRRASSAFMLSTNSVAYPLSSSTNSMIF